MRYVRLLVLPGLTACSKDAVVEPPLYECPPPCIAATFNVALDTVLVTGPSVVASNGRPAFPPDQVSLEYLLRNPGDTTTTTVHVSIRYLVPEDYDDPYVDMWYGGVRWFDLYVLPDYAWCDPSSLQPGGSVTLSAYNCGIRPPTSLDWQGDEDPALLRRFHS